jgi:hypothetical protein
MVLEPSSKKQWQKQIQHYLIHWRRQGYQSIFLMLKRHKDTTSCACHSWLVPSCAGSNPASPANFPSLLCLFTFYFVGFVKTLSLLGCVGYQSIFLMLKRHKDTTSCACHSWLVQVVFG